MRVAFWVVWDGDGKFLYATSNFARAAAYAAVKVGSNVTEEYFDP